MPTSVPSVVYFCLTFERIFWPPMFTPMRWMVIAAGTYHPSRKFHLLNAKNWFSKTKREKKTDFFFIVCTNFVALDIDLKRFNDAVKNLPYF